MKSNIYFMLIFTISMSIISNCGGGGGGGGSGTNGGSSDGSTTSFENGDFEGKSASGYPWITYNGGGVIITIASPGKDSNKSGQIFFLNSKTAEKKEFSFYSGSFNRKIVPEEKQINEYEIPEFATGTKFQGSVWAKIPDSSPLINGGKASLRISCYRNDMGVLKELSKVEMEKQPLNVNWEELKVEGDVATGTQFIWFSLVLIGDSSWSSGGVYFDNANFSLLK